jgi:hypothetical protein
MATRDKSIWILLIFICSGLVIGGLLGEMASQVDWLSWLSYGQQFGLKEPFTLELNVIKITFGLMLNINIASIIGLAIALFLYRKI